MLLTALEDEKETAVWDFFASTLVNLGFFPLT